MAKPGCLPIPHQTQPDSSFVTPPTIPLPTVPPGLGVQDATRGPSPTPHSQAGPPTPMDHPKRQASPEPAVPPGPAAREGGYGHSGLLDIECLVQARVAWAGT
jgi:hypothetical protein